MKKLFYLILLLFSVSAYAQPTVTQELQVKKTMQLKSIKITDFQQDTTFNSDAKIPTSKAIHDFVVGRLASIAPGGSGTLTNFTSGNLSPLFTVGVSGATTAPVVAYTLSNAAAYTNFGNRAGSSGIPSYYLNPFIDSVRISNDSIYGRVNTVWKYQYKINGTDVNAWHVGGDALTAIGVFGSTNNFGLKFLVNNIVSGSIDLIHNNTSFGHQSLRSITTGANNVAIGYYALNANTTGIGNISFGLNLYSNTTGSNNIGIGVNALATAVTTDGNIAIGAQAAYGILSGNNNVFIGNNVLPTTNTTGGLNTLIGANADVAATSTTGGIGLGANSKPATNQLYIADNIIRIKLAGLARSNPGTYGLVDSTGLGDFVARRIYTPADTTSTIATKTDLLSAGGFKYVAGKHIVTRDTTIAGKAYKIIDAVPSNIYLGDGLSFNNDSTIDVNTAAYYSKSQVDSISLANSRPYKVYTAKITQFTPFESTGGNVLYAGERITIVTYNAGDDFSSSVASIVSGTINTTGCVFISNGNDPDDWTHASDLISLGAPIATVLENTIGDVSWDYLSEGHYLFGTTGDFPIDKTFLQNSLLSISLNDQTFGIRIYRNSGHRIYVDTYGGLDFSTLSNDRLTDYMFEVRIYN